MGPNTWDSTVALGLGLSVLDLRGLGLRFLIPEMGIMTPSPVARVRMDYGKQSAPEVQHEPDDSCFIFDYYYYYYCYLGVTAFALLLLL